MRKTIIAAVCATHLLALAACGGADSGASEWPSQSAPPKAVAVAQKPLPPACTLVTAEEAGAIIGQEVGLMGDEPENCVWASAGNPGMFTMVMVQLARESSVAQAETMFDAMSNAPGALNALINDQAGSKTQKSGQEIDGLGDAAWRSGSNADLIGTQQLVVRKGTTVISINITGMTKDGKLKGFEQRLEAAARTAVSRL